MGTRAGRVHGLRVVDGPPGGEGLSRPVANSGKIGRTADTKGATRMAGIGLGGILVIIGIILLITGSTIWGIILALVGLAAFGGFAKGKWY